MSDDLVNEYGVSKESIQSFTKRNDYPAHPRYPQDLISGKQVQLNNQIPYLVINKHHDADWNKMYHEAKSLSKHYVPHRTHETHQGWSSLVIHGISSVHTESSHTYGHTDETAPWRWTDIADLCPTITNYFKNDFKYKRYFRIRIMKLSPGGWIIPHKDSITEDENHIGPVNIALNNPEGCKFYMDNIGYLPWETGRIIKLNLYNVHCVYNNSNEDRYHMIVHGWMDSAWQEFMLDSYNYWKKIYV